jgi:hypothetical protein
MCSRPPAPLPYQHRTIPINPCAVRGKKKSVQPEARWRLPVTLAVGGVARFLKRSKSRCDMVSVNMVSVIERFIAN